MQVHPYPEFHYSDTQSYDENYYKWKDMSDYEAKQECRNPYTEDEGKSIFRKMWGYKALTGLNVNRVF